MSASVKFNKDPQSTKRVTITIDDTQLTVLPHPSGIVMHVFQGTFSPVHYDSCPRDPNAVSIADYASPDPFAWYGAAGRALYIKSGMTCGKRLMNSELFVSRWHAGDIGWFLDSGGPIIKRVSLAFRADSIARTDFILLVCHGRNQPELGQFENLRYWLIPEMPALSGGEYT
jgi:hypothetical protein